MQSSRGLAKPALSRRSVLKLGAAGLLAAELELLDRLGTMPDRLALAASPLPDIQFDIASFIPPARSIDGVLFRFPPAFTFFLTARLTRNPTKQDQARFAAALDQIEAVFPFSPQGVFTFVGYGIPYFNRLPGGMTGPLVFNTIPHLHSPPGAPARLVLEEAVPSPSDVSPQNPTIVKRKFNVPVKIESNDVLFTLRSDSLVNLIAVTAWLQGSGDLLERHIASPEFEGLFQFDAPRVQFVQIGLPRKVADFEGLSFHRQVNDRSPMWMGFADQQVDSSGPAIVTTFVGDQATPERRFTQPGSYFDFGSIQHLSHVIQDLEQFYKLPSGTDPGEPFRERVQYMFRSNQQGTPDGLPSDGNADQFENGGGPAFLANVNQGGNDAFDSASTLRRIGHLNAIQQESRFLDGSPAHLRMDGPGFDSMDVPDGTRQPKLQFTMFQHTANFFKLMRDLQSADNLAAQQGVPDNENGIERFITATRRQNFLVPPRRHRSFPLLEQT
jgi:hypothetical protein